MRLGRHEFETLGLGRLELDTKGLVGFEFEISLPGTHVLETF